MVKMKRSLMVLFLLCIFFTLVACSSASNSSNSEGEEGSGENTGFNPDEADGQTVDEVRSDLGPVPVTSDSIQLGAVAKAFENEYWRTLKEGMETGASKFNEAGFDLTIDVKSPQGEADEEGQLAIVRDMINKEYTALLLSPISDSNLVPGVEDALEADIPVLNVNDGIIEEAPSFVGPKASENGERAAEWIAEQINSEGKVAIVVGMPKAFAARQRTLGFETWIADNAPDMEIAEKQNADWDRSKAKDIAETWIKKHDDLKAIFANNDTMALGVQEAVNASGKDILVVGVDGIGEAYDSIRAGELDATIDSFPLYKGQIAIEMALRNLGGQELPRVIWTPQALIDATNVDTPAEEIIGWSEAELE
ncbi:sugar ABC transporter substrate-binding protein [Gracilibacillus massiliensis]|uniref:sugar ABC transporter substrate-binding protein n=1 Tax=Gracilibacillus massiliensis TaxID=1564956 RepID=UPI000AC429C1|nr:substrate-binding domain-containing protein [Gracilibacillus massiliensis]